MRKLRALSIAGLAVLISAGAAVMPAQSHHSFAMFDDSKVYVFTGVVVRINPDANHLQIYFAPLNEERKTVLRDSAGKPIVWAVEMAGSAEVAREGVTVNTFKPGTIMSVGLHPLRSSQPAGDRQGGLFRCPENTPPAPGAHCDSVEGHVLHGEGALPEPTEPAPAQGG